MAPAVFTPRPIDHEITIAEGITVKDLAERLEVKARDLMQRLISRGVFATINQTLDPTVATNVAHDFGAEARVISFEQETAEAAVEQTLAEEGETVTRPPVVTIMGHVDHGKTSLLDAIRQTHVTEQEAGGITQHIGAYQVEINGRKITFIDTPGHEAFTRMRARGAKVTDIVVLVVAADDGVMPQTLEAIDHARAARVPIVAAVNKIDKPDAQPERVKRQLADRGLMPEEWGGQTVTVEVSAKQKTNLDLLLEMILLVADMGELKANPSRPAMATVLEAELDKGRGPVATVLVQQGTLGVGDPFIVGPVFGRVRALLNDRGQQIENALPSTPVQVLGLSSVPQSGDQFQVVSDVNKAKQIAVYREQKAREAALARSAARLSLDKLHEQVQAGEVKELNLILKADVHGSAEVLSDTLAKLSNEKVKVKMIHTGVGAITESDVLLASASNAIIIGFSVRPERNAVETADQEKVDIRLHTIIYELVDEMKKAMAGLLEPTIREVPLGRAEVRNVFHIPKVGAVAGCYVDEGKLTRSAQVRLLRDNVVIYTGRVASLRRFKEDASEVKSGLECGAALENYSDIKLGDVIEAYATEKVAAEVPA
jgi:translation initiation factor IF-2